MSGGCRFYSVPKIAFTVAEQVQIDRILLFRWSDCEHRRVFRVLNLWTDLLDSSATAGADPQEDGTTEGELLRVWSVHLKALERVGAGDCTRKVLLSEDCATLEYVLQLVLSDRAQFNRVITAFACDYPFFVNRSGESFADDTFNKLRALCEIVHRASNFDTGILCVGGLYFENSLLPGDDVVSIV